MSTRKATRAVKKAPSRRSRSVKNSQSKRPGKPELSASLTKRIMGWSPSPHRYAVHDLPSYRELGELMIAAKGEMKRGEFGPWCRKTFCISPTSRAKYMLLAKEWPKHKKALSGRGVDKSKLTFSYALRVIKGSAKTGSRGKRQPASRAESATGGAKVGPKHVHGLLERLELRAFRNDLEVSDRKQFAAWVKQFSKNKPQRKQLVAHMLRLSKETCWFLRDVLDECRPKPEAAVSESILKFALRELEATEENQPCG